MRRRVYECPLPLIPRDDDLLALVETYSVKKWKGWYGSSLMIGDCIPIWKRSSPLKRF